MKNNNSVVTVFITRSFKSIKNKVEQNILYYDPITKKLIKQRGGKIETKYVYDDNTKSYILKPVVVDVYRNDRKQIDNIDKIKKWFNTYKNYNDGIELDEDKSNDNMLIFSVQNKELDDFAYQLDRQGFAFEVKSA